MSKLTFRNRIEGSNLLETIDYPNQGKSYFYEKDNNIYIVDENICNKDIPYPYSLITEQQNYYMSHYPKVYRSMIEDIDNIEEYNEELLSTSNREEILDISPLEFLFEKNFSDIYGMSSLKYLWHEYGIIDNTGHTYYLDYLVNTKSGAIAVEENGIKYHHPQLIGPDRYRVQLHKQNTAMDWNIKLYRFSTEDCGYTNRNEDDIKKFFGSIDNFIDKGILVERPFKLYEHQESTLKDIQEQRNNGIKAFLVVFPTGTGKSKIIEEDIKEYSKEYNNFKALILAPNTAIIDDWKDRVSKSLPDIHIDIYSYSYMSRHFQEYKQDEYNYIVIDEAHHAVAPGLKRVIEYFNPNFLIGCTATDQRLDRKKLEDVFGSYQTNLSLKEAMEKGIIADASVYRIETNIDLSKVRFNGKDYINADLEKSIRVTSRNELIGDVLQQYFTGGEMEDKQGIIFCVNTSHTKEMEKILNARGISAKSYVGNTSESVMNDFKNKKIRFLCVCNRISEGWDYPELGIIVMARPTLSRVLYTQQIGRGLRKTSNKDHVYIIDVVDEYGAMAKPCSMHSILNIPYYVPFGIVGRTYQEGDIITIDGLHETIDRIVKVDIDDYEEMYGDYMSPEQMARDFFVSTSSINNWIRNKKIIPDVVIPFGNRKIYLFSPATVESIREKNNFTLHNDDTIKEDFFSFLEERDYTLSYKMPFLLSFIKNMNSIGDAKIEDVLSDYIQFYQDRIDQGLVVDRSTCPYNDKTLKDRKYIQENMLTNPFEKFERKRFMYHSKDLGVITMNHSLLDKLSKEDIEIVKKQMEEDLVNYYKNL